MAVTRDTTTPLNGKVPCVVQVGGLKVILINFTAAVFEFMLRTPFTIT